MKKNFLSKGLKLLKNPEYRFRLLASIGVYNHLDDKIFLEKYYKTVFHTELDLKTPKTFNEKLQWLKLYDRRPEYTMMVDKYRVRDYITNEIGQEYLIPLLGVWEDPDEIDFDSLPNQFVLKCTHNSGLGMCICKDKSKLDIKKVKSNLRRGLKQDYYLTLREWPYKDVPRKIICEKYMKDNSTSELRDYKFYCFNGNPTFCQVISDRNTNETIDFFDMQWNHQEMTGLALPHRPFSKKSIPVPTSLQTMVHNAKILSQGIPFVRIDFYEINGRMYFGEITFFPAGGFGLFTPDKWNYTLGDAIQIGDQATSYENKA